MTELAEDEIPRTNAPDMDGGDLTVQYDPAAHSFGVVVSDGTRFVIYVPMVEGEAVDITSLDLAIVPAYIEAGRFREVNVLLLSDGKRTAKYVPQRKV